MTTQPPAELRVTWCPECGQTRLTDIAPRPDRALHVSEDRGGMCWGQRKVIVYRTDGIPE